MALESPEPVDLEFFQKIGHNKILYEYHDLDKNSSVLILGGYKGDSAQVWHSKYGCEVLVYEPIEDYFNEAVEKLKKSTNVKVINKAVTCDGRSINLNINNDATHLMELQNYDLKTSLLCESDKLNEVLSKQLRHFDLIEVNIEGMEYELISELLMQPLEILPKTLILQRHKVAGYERLSKLLTKQLEEKYECIFNIPYVWERWELRNNLDLKKESLSFVRRHLEAADKIHMKPEQKGFEYTYIVVATNLYYEYFIDLVRSIEENSDKKKVQILVFTNRESDFLESDLLTIRHVFIRSLPWPDITLFRFHILLKYWNWIEGEIIIWTDADMLVLKPIKFEHLMKKAELLLSRHPGYAISKAKVWQKLKKLEFLDVLQRFLIIKRHRRSPEGWETNNCAAAFVPFENRNNYVQGGFWIGNRISVKCMAEKIIDRISNDLRHGYVPRYHDETYLNWYYSIEKVGLLPRDFVVEGTYWWQNNAEATILCVDKSKAPIKLKKVIDNE